MPEMSCRDGDGQGRSNKFYGLVELGILISVLSLVVKVAEGGEMWPGRKLHGDPMLRGS